MALAGMNRINELRYTYIGIGLSTFEINVFSDLLIRPKGVIIPSVKFDRIGRFVSEEVVVVLQLVPSKCLLILLCGSEACGLNKTD